jgi:hypothetical protein
MRLALSIALTLAVAACGPGRTPAASPPVAAPVVTPPAPPPAAAAPALVAVAPAVVDEVPQQGGAILGERIYGGDAAVNGGSVAVDRRGNLFVVGSFGGTATFGRLPPITSEKEDAYLVKMDPAGEPLWSKRLGGSGLDYGDDVAVDAEDNVWVSGAFESRTIDLGGGPLRCAGVHDLFLAKLDGEGKLLFAKRFGDAQDQIDLRLRAAPDAGVVASGWFNGTIDFGAGPVHSPWNKASFVARLGGDGRARWSVAFGHRLDYAATDAVVGADGDVYVSGGSDGTSEFVPGGRPATAYDLGPVLLVFDAAGKRRAACRYGSGADNLSTAVGVDSAGNVRLVAASRGGMDFGAGPAGAAQGQEALVVSSFDSRGDLLWSRRLLPSSPMLSVAAARVDGEGNTVLAGQLNEPTQGSSRGFVIKLTSDGEVAWSLEIDRGGVMTWMSGLAFDPHGRIVATGTVARTLGSSMRNGLLVLTIAP